MDDQDSPLFNTRQQAGQAAARSAGQRYQRILAHLHERGPSTLITELLREGKIERTGQTRVKPETGCSADVYRLAEPAAGIPELVEQLHGCPPTLILEGELWTRGPTLGQTDAPGVPYHRSAKSGGAHLVYRIELLECPNCGGPLRLSVEKRGQAEVKTYPCPRCKRPWHLALVNEPGHPPQLALLLKHL